MPFVAPYHNDFIADVAVQRLHQVTFSLKPTSWQEYQSLVTLKWKSVKFTEANKSRMPSGGGVYTFVVIPKVAKHPKCAFPIYVGETINFQNRYKDYLADRTNVKARPRVKVMFALWSGYLTYCYAEVSNAALITQVQNNLIKAFDPVINMMYPKEVQATITAASI